MSKPQRHRNHVLETASNKFFNNCLPNEWFADKPEHDYGIDYNTNIVINGEVTGLNFSVQLKAKERDRNPEQASVSLKNSTLRLYRTRLEPVLLVIFVQEEQEAYWYWTNDLNVDLATAATTVKINISKQNKLSTLQWDEVVRYVQDVFSVKSLIDGIKSLEYDSMSNAEILAWKYYYAKNYADAAYYFKNLLSQATGDEVAILEGLAHSLYMSFQYQEALRTINKCIEKAGSENQFLTKACILAEDGISSGIRGKLIEAKQIFGKHLDKGLADAGSHYNYANVLRSLGDIEEALEQYKRSLSIDPYKAEAWKNLGSVYYDLGNHEEELRCYDKALKLKPDLPQALFSKGVTLSHIFKKYAVGMALMKKSLQYGDDMLISFATGYYWMAYTAEKLGNIEEALTYIDKGLSEAPESVFMLDFKTELLVANYARYPKLKEVAIEFFEYRLALSSHYGSLYHLIQLKEMDQNAMFERISKFTPILSQVSIGLMNKCGLAFQDFVPFLRHYDKYLEHRESRPINRYMDHLISGHYSIPASFFDMMDLIFAKAFSDGVEECYRNGNLQEAGKKILSGLLFLPRIIQLLIDGYVYDQEEKIAVMAHIYASFPTIAIREFGAQFGLITGRFRFEEMDPEAIMKESWYDDVQDQTLFYTNRILKLLREDGE